MYIFEIPEMAPNLHAVNRVNPGFSAKPFSTASSSWMSTACYEMVSFCIVNLFFICRIPLSLARIQCTQFWFSDTLVCFSMILYTSKSSLIMLMISRSLFDDVYFRILSRIMYIVPTSEVDESLNKGNFRCFL